ncbi:ATP-dependent RNA helicase dbp7 [Yamadazyma tenuis]|uniref:ATP-dependent RNA helicase n=1 Tax=Candida tenuis (strain ATCC 10573 / BCRC 21748 / CBS 615 / JCM 9827 / NBRC 10315 / NRRL Y-1498 / VKM Y-70) TaxID=590646 RepID=G3BFH6_CANTC|nr:DEAD-domain-containing protein [Yamadazyma tenuis ATCC 10573]EGV60695.1 DEAD-domain-containing protein [Yamadazyma tenuis ATCC 10573]WEJ94052.1 ATP-dependent RNA helicase dbp7 [Yamadazyma tenuis]
MDEDDGLLLNFAVDSGAPAKKARGSVKVTGGRWKDRRKMQLTMSGRGRNEKKSHTRTSGVNSIEVPNARTKRTTADPREANGSGTAPDHLQAQHEERIKRIKFSEGKGEFGGKNNSYVSSLFTSNTKSSVLEESKKDEEKEDVTYLPSNAPLKDATTFEGLGLNPKLVSHLTETLRFKNPTKVQRSTIPSLLFAKSDLFIKAQTGSGKTLAFLLPIFHKLMQEDKHKITRESGVFAMILAPTRELATQIYSVLETLSRCHHQIVPGIVIGGEKKKSEKARLRKGVNILVGTPGRLADHIENTQVLNLSQLRWLILDEGDRLVELGFEETISKITNQITKTSEIHHTAPKWQGLPTKRVNVLCSATMQENVEKLGSILLDNPEMITVDSKRAIEGTVIFNDDDVEETETEDTSQNMTAPDQLTQNVLIVPPKLRLVTLNAMFKNFTHDRQVDHLRTMVFFTCSDSVNYHFDVFTRGGKPLSKHKEGSEDDAEEFEYSIATAPLISSDTAVFKLHGSMTQQERTSTLQGFVKDSSVYKHSILFCTDVASRGLDLPNISEVVEYDPPFSIEDHLHRIGRSARVGNEGSASIFLLPGIEETYIDAKLSIVHPKGSLKIEGYEKLLKKAYSEPDSAKGRGKWDIHATTWHLNIERWILEDSGVHDKATLAFTSHIRAYATHLSSERNFFNVKELHLGHLAKAFGLRENPKKLGRSFGNNQSKDSGDKSKRTRKLDPRQKMLHMARMAVKASSSEFNY